jgi:hypothetical protein
LADDIETDLKRNRMKDHALDSDLGYRQGMSVFAHGTEHFVTEDVGNLTSQGTNSVSKNYCSVVFVMYCHISHCLQISVIVIFFLITLSGSNS